MTATTGEGMTQAVAPPQDECELEVKVLRSFAEIAPLRGFWDSCPTHRDAAFDFYAFFVETHPDARRPHILAVYRAETPVALLLGRFEETAIGAKIGYLRLPTPRLRLLNFFYGGRLGEASAEIDRALIASIRVSLQAEADAAFFHFLPIDSPLDRLITELPVFWRRDRFPATVQHHSMDLPTGPGQFWASLSSKERNNHKRRKRRLEQQFGDKLRIDCIMSEHEIDRLVADAEQVARLSYQRGLGVGFQDGPVMRKRLALEAAKGRLRGYVLYIEERARAFWITSFHRDVLYSDFLGYDPQFAAYAPGMFLVVEALDQFSRAAPASGRLRLDFGMGEGEWKAILSDRSGREVNRYVFATTWRAAATWLVQTGAALVSGALRGALKNTKLLVWVKRRWRRQRSPSQNG